MVGVTRRPDESSMPPGLTATAARDAAQRFLNPVGPVTMARSQVPSGARQPMFTRSLTIARAHNLETGVMIF